MEPVQSAQAGCGEHTRESGLPDDDLAQSAQGRVCFDSDTQLRVFKFWAAGAALKQWKLFDPLTRTLPAATTNHFDSTLGAEQVIFRERLSCGLAGASLVMAQEFRARYTANQNPTLVSLSAWWARRRRRSIPCQPVSAFGLVATWSPESRSHIPCSIPPRKLWQIVARPFGFPGSLPPAHSTTR